MTTKRFVVTDEQKLTFLKRHQELMGRFLKGVVDPELTLYYLQQAMENINPFDYLIIPQIKSWEEFYQKYFGMRVDFSRIIIPKHVLGFDRLIILVQGMMPQNTYDVCSHQFKTDRGTGALNQVIIYEDRSAKNGAYAIWVRDRVEADKELRDKSADDLNQERISGITMTERQLYELKYYDETAGEHLDKRNVTLCSGSRFPDGHVPHIYCRDNEFRMDGFSPDSALSCLRAREVVSA